MTTMQQAGTGAATRTTSVRDVSPLDVHRWLKAGEAVLIDVREADEHARERIAAARLVPLSKFDAECVKGARADQRVVFHCRGGKRAADACRMAIAAADPGVEVFNMSGGIEAWKLASLPVESCASAVARGMISVLRQVQLVIGVLLLVGSALAWFVHPGFLIVPAFLGAGLTFAGASGTCMLASLLSVMPWNKVCGPCASGKCG